MKASVTPEHQLLLNNKNSLSSSSSPEGFQNPCCDNVALTGQNNSLHFDKPIAFPCGYSVDQPDTDAISAHFGLRTPEPVSVNFLPTRECISSTYPRMVSTMGSTITPLNDSCCPNQTDQASVNPAYKGGSTKFKANTACIGNFLILKEKKLGMLPSAVNRESKCDNTSMQLNYDKNTSFDEISLDYVPAFSNDSVEHVPADGNDATPLQLLTSVHTKKQTSQSSPAYQLGCKRSGPTPENPGSSQLKIFLLKYFPHINR